MNTSCEQKLEHCCDNNNPIGDTNVDAVDSLYGCVQIVANVKRIVMNSKRVMHVRW